MNNLSELKQNLENLQTALSQKQSQISLLEEELQTRIKESEQVPILQQKLEELTLELNLVRNKSQEERNTLGANETQLCNQIRTLQNQLDQMREEKEQTSNQIKERMKELEKQLNQSQEQIRRNRVEIETLKSENFELNKEQNELVTFNNFIPQSNFLFFKK